MLFRSGWELYLIGDEVVACGPSFYGDPDWEEYDRTVEMRTLVTLSGDRHVAWVDKKEIRCYPPIDEDTLTKIADLTNAAYFRAEDVEGLREVYKQIDALERTEIESLGYLEYNEHFYWFLIPAIFILLLERLLLLTRFRRVPL